MSSVFIQYVYEWMYSDKDKTGNNKQLLFFILIALYAYRGFWGGSLCEARLGPRPMKTQYPDSLWVLQELYT